MLHYNVRADELYALCLHTGASPNKDSTGFCTPVKILCWAVHTVHNCSQYRQQRMLRSYQSCSADAVAACYQNPPHTTTA
jgi:hypothetical protein